MTETATELMARVLPTTRAKLAKAVNATEDAPAGGEVTLTAEEAYVAYRLLWRTTKLSARERKIARLGT